ncbi:Histone promoter control 2 (HPC2) [Beauveria brongniartii RCEF 3172]|uniref:Histone promoter control 2 (HPC2) n=1 Tax=Beauveria brongniartii RCEF 3172 TaxID=1081107 RepID=A0A167CU07_9HYPO|nr:Histone promoter control 2 (HPC2) [Beauveria brongniartii RCEF 3172]
MDEIVVSNDQRRTQQTTFQQYQPPGSQSNESPTPTRQVSTVMVGGKLQEKKYDLIDGKWVQLTAAGVPRKKPGRKPGANVKPKTDAEAKTRRPRKPRESDTPLIQRKRKVALTDTEQDDSDVSRALAHTGASPNSTSHSFLQTSPTQARSSPKMPKREGYPSSMQKILNDDPPPAASVPVRTSGQSYDPIRGISGPARDAPSHNPYSPASGSPRALASANKSPSIASLLEPAAPNMSPSNSHNGYPASRLLDDRSLQASPSNQPPRPFAARPAPEKSDALDVPRPVVNPSNFTTIANGPVRKVSPKHTGASTPRTDMDDLGTEGDGRSILDFGKAKPGEEADVPTIVLSIPIVHGETNKYVNFLRLAEDRYGWDALHPRLAANRDRKARIAAAAANLERIESGRESGDEMSVDLSDGEGSNPEVAGASGTDNQPKPTKKKRNFKEDQYDVDDEFVDDSEMLWEAQAAASRDGFFVYSGPLVPEVEKPPAGTEGPVRRGRGGRGSRGGRGGATRGAGAGRGGGPGSRGGIVRKPRISKAERLLREKEKAERDSMAQVPKTPTSNYVVPNPAPIQLGV